MARVTLFDPRLDAGRYLTKHDGMADPGDACESAKFGNFAKTSYTQIKKEKVTIQILI